MNFDIEYVVQVFPSILKYLPVTLEIAFLSGTIAMLLSICIVLLRHVPSRILQAVLNFYLDFFRGTPVVVQLFFLYYGLAQLFPIFKNLSGFSAAVIGLSLNASSYMSESIRGAVQSVHRRQTEAGLACGLTHLQVMRHIVFPQAAKVAVPTLVNDFIGLMKSTSVAFVLGVRDVMAQTKMLGGSSYRYFECYFVAIIIYFILTKLIHCFQKWLERKLDVTTRKEGAACSISEV